MNFWLFKSEPDKYSIEDLKNEPEHTACWDGIRNYQARNFLRDEVKIGDMVLYYHSRCEPPGVVGLAKVVKEAYPDDTAWDPKADYYDPKSKPENPTWVMVDVQWVANFPNFVSLADLKANPALEGMRVIMRGQRLSIQPVDKAHFQAVLKMGGLDPKSYL